MISVEGLYPGMKVRIVDILDESCWRDSYGKMDKWRGQTVTVSAVYGKYITIEDDAGEGPGYQDGHWQWPAAAIDCVVCGGPEDEDFDISSMDEIASLICGN